MDPRSIVQNRHQKEIQILKSVKVKVRIKMTKESITKPKRKVMIKSTIPATRSTLQNMILITTNQEVQKTHHKIQSKNTIPGIKIELILMLEEYPVAPRHVM